MSKSRSSTSLSSKSQGLFDSVSVLLGLRYTLARQRSRSVAFISRVAMIGIVLGVSLLIVVLSVMNGFDKELRERILRIMPQVTLYHAKGVEDWQDMRSQVLAHENIVGVSPFIELQGMVNVGKNTEPLLIYGIDEVLESSTSIIHQFLQPSTLAQLAKDSSLIVLGADLAAKLKVVRGDTVSIIIPRAEGQAQIAAVKRLQIADILTTGTEVDGSLALMGIEGAAVLSLHPQRVSGLHVKVDDLFLSSVVARDLQRQLPYGFYTTDWTRTHGNIYYAIQMSKNLVSLLLMLIIAIAAFNVVSTLVMAVIDKQSDIAILKTLGASNRQIVAIFIIQGTVISVIGTLLGVLFGVLLAFSVQDIVLFIESLLNVHFLKSDIYPISYLPSQLLWSDVLLVVLVSLLMSFLATLYPAWRAAKIMPADALRYD
jgi:lipoprotein-releasing system permease protein